MTNAASTSQYGEILQRFKKFLDEKTRCPCENWTERLSC